MGIQLKLKKALIKYRLGFYLIGFVLALILVATIADEKLLKLDYAIYKAKYFSSDNNKFDTNEIIFIDLPSVIGEKKIDYRNRLAKLLDTIYSLSSSSNRPKIIMDIIFEENGEPDIKLIEKINLLINNGIDVNGVFDPRKDGGIYNLQFNDNSRDSELYQQFSLGRLHTKIDITNEVIHYQSYINLIDTNTINTEGVTALPLKIANPNKSFTREPVQTYILPNGNHDDLKKFTWIYKPDEENLDEFVLINENLNNRFNVNNKFIIIGDFEKDLKEIDGEFVPGPFLVGWALLDQLKGNNLTIQPIDNVLMQFLIAIICIGFITLLFDWIYKRMKKLQTQPLIIATISLLAGLMILVGIFFFMPNNKIIRPGFPILSMVLVTVFIWQYKKRYIKLGQIDGSETYDIFISYSRKQSKWVKKNLYTPLKKFRNSDDKKIKIFFDEDSIPTGEEFQVYYRDAIQNSKMFIPIYSEDYFKSNHCKFEIDFAIYRETEKKGSETKFRIYPLAFNFDDVPEVYGDKNIFIIDDTNNFLKALKETLYKS